MQTNDPEKSNRGRPDEDMSIASLALVSQDTIFQRNIIYDSVQWFTTIQNHLHRPHLPPHRFGKSKSCNPEGSSTVTGPALGFTAAVAGSDSADSLITGRLMISMSLQLPLFFQIFTVILCEVHCLKSHGACSTRVGA